MQTIACFKGKFGSTEYYQTKMSAGTLINTVGFAKEMSEYSEMTADEKIQRDLDVNRVVMEWCHILHRIKTGFTVALWWIYTKDGKKLSLNH